MIFDHASVHSSRTLASGSCAERVFSIANCSGDNRASAQTAAPRIRALSSSRSAATRLHSAALPELPAAIRQLRIKRARPVRFTGVFANSVRKAASSSAKRASSERMSISRLEERSCSCADFANLFHGQTARQSSQPKIRLPKAVRSARGITPLCSIVRYEMQRRASS